MGKAPPTSNANTNDQSEDTSSYTNDSKSKHMKPMSNEEAIQYALNQGHHAYQRNMRRVRTSKVKNENGEYPYEYWSWDRKKKPKTFRSTKDKYAHENKKASKSEFKNVPLSHNRRSLVRTRTQTPRTVCLMHSSL